MLHVGPVATAVDRHGLVVAGVSAQGAAAAAGSFFLRQQLHRAIQRDFVNVIGLGDGFEHPVVLNVGAKAADTDLHGLTGLRVSTKLPG